MLATFVGARPVGNRSSVYLNGLDVRFWPIPDLNESFAFDP
jgi:hypothetical protein